MKMSTNVSTPCVFTARQSTAAMKSSLVPLKPVPKWPNQSSAPGARSWTISSMAAPSAPAPGVVGDCGTTLHVVVLTAGRSPLACAAASPSMPSEMTLTRTPEPSIPNVARRSSALRMASPAVVAAPEGTTG